MLPLSQTATITVTRVTICRPLPDQSLSHIPAIDIPAVYRRNCQSVTRASVYFHGNRIKGLTAMRR